MAYQPRPSHTDANRNLISNIHSRGLNPQAAADRILSFAAQMMAQRISGFSIREQIAWNPQLPNNSEIDFLRSHAATNSRCIIRSYEISISAFYLKVNGRVQSLDYQEASEDIDEPDVRYDPRRT